MAEAVARGPQQQEIAAELNLSLRTIEGLSAVFLNKKNLSNRVELALLLRPKAVELRGTPRRAGNPKTAFNPAASST